MTREALKKAGWRGAVLASIAATVALAGCGGSDPPVTSTIDLKSPKVGANGELNPDVRCGWGSLWIPLEWGEVPEDTKELAILLGRYRYTKENGERKAVVKFADLVSKFKPTEHRLVANVLPEDVTWSSFGTNCVTQPKGQHILLEVFALDRIRHRTMNPRLATRLMEEALADPHPTEGPRSPGELTADAAAVGRLFTTFTGPHYLAGREAK
jgi:hypothetical protein